ncbi:hypothetical protein C0995_004349 [Termitomyces sp. Mi166|nr:hypothetical protein C0995_004349 [Termitomyces sp. Mi166\
MFQAQILFEGTATEACMDTPRLASSLIITGDDTTSGTTVHVDTSQHSDSLTSTNGEGPGGNSNSVTVSQAPPSAADDSNNMIKNGLRTTLNGVELLLKKIEKSLSGTPFQVLVGVVNTLIELKNASLSFSFMIH